MYDIQCTRTIVPCGCSYVHDDDFVCRYFVWTVEQHQYLVPSIRLIYSSRSKLDLTRRWTTSPVGNAVKYCITGCLAHSTVSHSTSLAHTKLRLDWLRRGTQRIYSVRENQIWPRDLWWQIQFILCCTLSNTRCTSLYFKSLVVSCACVR